MTIRGWAGASLLALACAVSQFPAAAQDAGQPDPAAVKAREQQVRQWKQTYGEGPYPDEIAAFVAPRPEPLKPYYQALLTGGERNAVLNLSRLGLAAMELQQWADAERAYDMALLRIETVYSKDPRAEAARSLWHKESNKDWKGEAYERAMAYYYRGLLYLRKGDYNNAHASFKEAEFQDTVSETENLQSDFALLNYLVGWSSQCAGDKGVEDIDRAIKTQPELTPPGPTDNVLLIAELGHGPIKRRDGQQKEKMVFGEATGFPESGAVFSLVPTSGGPKAMIPRAVPLHLASSVYYQATTRGGRKMDGILNGKASFKSTTESLASGTTAVGLQMMNQSGSDPTGGMVVALAGLGMSLFASAMKTDADIRQWDSLPDKVLISTTSMNGPFTASASFTAADGPTPLTPTPVMQGASGKCAIVWTRSRSALLGADTPGDDPKVRAAVARKKDVVVKDKKFRADLAMVFGG